MIEFAKWLLSTYPVIATILILALAFLLIAVVVMFFIAYLQGRELSFWPPKIGGKPAKSESKGSSTSNPIKVGSEHANARNIEGIWQSSYSFESQEEIHTHEHLIELKQVGNQVTSHTLQSNSPHKFKMKGEVRFGIYFVGVWERPSKDSIYHGTFQFRIEHNGTNIGILNELCQNFC